MVAAAQREQQNIKQRSKKDQIKIAEQDDLII